MQYYIYCSSVNSPDFGPPNGECTCRCGVSGGPRRVVGIEHWFGYTYVVDEISWVFSVLPEMADNG